MGNCELAPLVQMRLEQSAFFHRRFSLPDHLSHCEFERVWGCKDEHFLQPFDVVIDRQGCVPWRVSFVIHGFGFLWAQLAIQLLQFADYLPLITRCSIHSRADASTSDFYVR